MPKPMYYYHQNQINSSVLDTQMKTFEKKNISQPTKKSPPNTSENKLGWSNIWQIIKETNQPKSKKILRK